MQRLRAPAVAGYSVYAGRPPAEAVLAVRRPAPYLFFVSAKEKNMEEKKGAFGTGRRKENDFLPRSCPTVPMVP